MISSGTFERHNYYVAGAVVARVTMQHLKALIVREAREEIERAVEPVGWTGVVRQLDVVVVFVEPADQLVAVRPVHIELEAFKVVPFQSHQITTKGNSGGEKVRRGVVHVGMSVVERSSTVSTWAITASTRPAIQTR